jgi:hypothetical protein
MPISATPVLGAGLNNIIRAGELAPKQAVLGTVVKGDDGFDYVFAQASAAIAGTGNVVVILTTPANTVATGAGAWTWVPAIALAIGDRAWFRRTLP